ncbi:MAG: Halobacterium phage phiH [Pseudomonadota bacterium]|jgi:hypothetical protein
MRDSLASKRKDITWTEKSVHGENNPNYGGGKYIDDKGYVRILNPDHKYNIKGYVYEHRLVFERYLNRYLEPWETVHHINEIKADNRVDNLFLCTVPEHSAIHREGRKPSEKHRAKMRETMRRKNDEIRERSKINPKNISDKAESRENGV